MVENSTKGNPNGPTILTPDEVVNQVLKLYGSVPQNQTQESNGQVEPKSNVAVSKPDPKNRVIIEKKPTLPNVKAGNKSPARKKVRSIADIRKLADGLDDY